MYKLDYWCSLHGDNFDPTPFLQLADINVISCNYVGDIRTRRYKKGEPYPYASISFTSLDDDFDVFIQRLHEVKHLFMECDAEIKIISIARYYSAQCNMEFNTETLLLIGDLGLALTISCYKLDKDDWL